MTGKRKLHIEPRPDGKHFSLKIAFATQDRQHVDQHFGSAAGVLIYGVSKQTWSLLEAVEYVSGGDTHDRLPQRILDLHGCVAIYCNACGAAAIRQLLEQQIHPVKVLAGHGIHELLTDIQQQLKGQPMGWLGRAMKLREQQEQVPVNKRLSQLMDEEW